MMASLSIFKVPEGRRLNKNSSQPEAARVRAGFCVGGRGQPPDAFSSAKNNVVRRSGQDSPLWPRARWKAEQSTAEEEVQDDQMGDDSLPPSPTDRCPGILPTSFAESTMASHTLGTYGTRTAWPGTVIVASQPARQPSPGSTMCSLDLSMEAGRPSHVTSSVTAHRADSRV